MPTVVVDMLTFISMINTTSETLKARNFLICQYFNSTSSWNFVLSWVEHEKSCITSGPVKHNNAWKTMFDPSIDFNVSAQQMAMSADTKLKEIRHEFNKEKMRHIGLEKNYTDKIEEQVGEWGVFFLTLCIQMDFPIHVDTMSMGLSIVYFKGSQLKFSKVWCVSVSESCFIFNSKQCRPWWNAALCCKWLQLGLHCLPKYPFRGFQYTKG